MADIFHSLRVRAGADDVLDAVSRFELVNAWWPNDRLVFSPASKDSAGEAAIAWNCVEGPAEWVGTSISFDVAVDGLETVLRFSHRNWREASDAFAECTTKWGRVLMAVKSRVETPDADDTRV